MKNKIILFISALLFSCSDQINNSQDTVTLKVLEQLAQDTDFSKNQLVLIIPFDGCISCFEKAVALIPEVSEKQGLIIMPNLHKRMVTNTLKDLGIDRDIVIIDTLQLTIKRNLVEGNPKLFLIENNKIMFSESVEYWSIEKIKKILAAN